MTSGHDPFGPPPGDPFGASAPPPVYGGPPQAAPGWGMPPTARPAPSQQYNTLAVLAPILGVVVPPAGIALGHIALPQIERDHQRGRAAAISGLVIGYAMSLALIVAGLWWATQDGSSTTSAGSSNSNQVATAPSAATAPSVVTSVTRPTSAPRIKLDLATVAPGTCVEVQIRSTSRSDALDLYQTECRHITGVYVVSSRVGSAAECNSESVAAPPDRSFALCLNPY